MCIQLFMKKIGKTQFPPQLWMLSLRRPFRVCSFVLLVYFQPWEDEPETSYVREYPITPIQFILYLYHNQPDFVPICMTSDFLTALSATLFPYQCSSEANSEVATPQEDFKVTTCFRLSFASSPATLRFDLLGNNSISGFCFPLYIISAFLPQNIFLVNSFRIFTSVL